MKYIFKTTTTMKEYNNKKWWIDSDIIREISVNADSLKQALEEYREIVKDKFYIEISNNAIKNKNPMFIDTQMEIVNKWGMLSQEKRNLRTETIINGVHNLLICG